MQLKLLDMISGLGSLAFRKSMTASLFSFGNGPSHFEAPQDESIGSAGSLAHRSHDEEDEEDGEDEQDFGPEFTPVAIFLAALGMQVLDKLKPNHYKSDFLKQK